MSKVILIDHEPYSLKRDSIFHISELKNRGIDIEVWDCSAFFYPGMPIPDVIESSIKKEIFSLSDIEKLLDATDVGNTLFVVEVMNEWRNRAFFKLLSDRGCYQIKIELYANSNLPGISLLRKLRHSKPAKIVDALKNKVNSAMLRCYNKRFHVRGFNKYIGSGSDPRIDTHINHPDYQQMAAAIEFDNEKPYAVFLDQYYPLHPDLKFFLTEKLGDATKYQASMRDFFDRYERETGHEVIIAAHPKAQYLNGEFGCRQYITYKSAELVKGAQCVMMHCSSAISFAVIADKPIMLLNNKEYRTSFSQQSYLDAISQTLDLPCFDVDLCTVDQITGRKIGMQTRNDYTYSYLTSKGIEDKLNQDILFDFFVQFSPR